VKGRVLHSVFCIRKKGKNNPPKNTLILVYWKGRVVRRREACSLSGDEAGECHPFIGLGKEKECRNVSLKLGGSQSKEK